MAADLGRMARYALPDLEPVTELPDKEEPGAVGQVMGAVPQPERVPACT